tara:strand:+ start:747 stop:896 length:150 start_codon:yes stop_codon:yes gene_type:complete
MAYKLIAEQTFKNDMNNGLLILSEYQKQIDDVKQTIPTDPLLVFEDTEG